MYICSSHSASPLKRAISMLERKLSFGSPIAIEVRRDYVLTNALKEAGKKKFDVSKKIKVMACKDVFLGLWWSCLTIISCNRLLLWEKEESTMAGRGENSSGS